MATRLMTCARFAAIVNNHCALVARDDHERFARHFRDCTACKEGVCRRNETWRELFLKRVVQITNDRFKERLATLQVWEKTLAAFLSLAEAPQHVTKRTQPKAKKARS